MLNSISQIRAATSPNTRQKDAPHFYISWSVHCFRPMTRRYATFIAGESNDFFLVDVIRNAPQQSNQMVEISGSMNNAVHLNRMTADNIEDQI